MKSSRVQLVGVWTINIFPYSSSLAPNHNLSTSGEPVSHFEKDFLFVYSYKHIPDSMWSFEYWVLTSRTLDNSPSPTSASTVTPVSSTHARLHASCTPHARTARLMHATHTLHASTYISVKFMPDFCNSMLGVSNMLCEKLSITSCPCPVSRRLWASQVFQITHLPTSPEVQCFQLQNWELFGFIF